MKLCDLPSVNSIIESINWEEIQIPRAYVITIIRDQLSRFRKEGEEGLKSITSEEVVESINDTIEKMKKPNIKQVINGTGIVLHTGLGRAPISKSILQNIVSELEGYASLELDLTTGKRGERNVHISSLLSSITNADASLIVNNNAAAVLLSLNSLADGKEVIVSRGQLVEIGGSFRMPDVIKKSGATLVEVGTTNRTHFKDYQSAISEKSGAILFVHTSNYRVTGFTKEVPIFELTDLAKKHRIPLIVDLGSGALFNFEKVGLPHEPQVSEILKYGVDLVTFSGDKLLGGPQAGLICGKKRWIRIIHNNPLYRAMRCDKITISLMEQTLKTFRDEGFSEENLSNVLLQTGRKTLRKRAQRVVQNVPDEVVEKLGLSVVDSEVEAGSGSLPTELIESSALQFDCKHIKPTELSKRFRQWRIPIIGYISVNRFYIDLKGVLPKQDKLLKKAICDIGEDV